MEYEGASESWRDDQPWDEFDWEAFLQEQDHRTERYMQLEEKYRYLPDADDRIARDMGWEMPPCFGAEPPECDECDKRLSCDWHDADAEEEAPEELDEAESHAYEDDPLWHRAHEVAVRKLFHGGLAGVHVGNEVSPRRQHRREGGARQLVVIHYENSPVH